MSKPAEQHEQNAMSHMAKARELHDIGDPAAADEEARLAISQMRASARARLETPFGGINIVDSTPERGTETYGAHLTRLRLAAGFAERADLARAIFPEDMAARLKLGSLLLRYETKGALPRPTTYKQLAPPLGVSVKDLDPKRFTPGTKAPNGKTLPARAASATKAAAAPAGAFLRGITIEPAGEGLTLIRFEAVVPAKGSQDLVARLLSAALASNT